MRGKTIMVPFKNYIIRGKNHYREHFGLDFEQFSVGQRFHHRPGITISQQDNAEEALDTINNAQLHYDAHYASQTEWSHCLGVSTMTLQKVIGMTSKTFYRQKNIMEFIDIAMTHPVFAGDTLYAESEIINKEEDAKNPDLGIVTVVTQGFNQNNDVVTTIKYNILIYKSGKHPQEIAEKLHRGQLDQDKFSSHRLLEDGSFMEQMGIYFEDLDVGEIYEHRPGKTFSEEENRLHALRSLLLCPQYSDMNYIKTYCNDKMMITAPLIVGSLTALTTRTFDRVVANLGWNNIKLLSPVYAGDTLYAVSKIIDKRESKSRPTEGIMHVTSEGYNQKGKLVCSYDRHFLIYKKGMGPYKKAGY